MGKAIKSTHINADNDSIDPGISLEVGPPGVLVGNGVEVGTAVGDGKIPIGTVIAKEASVPLKPYPSGMIHK